MHLNNNPVISNRKTEYPARFCALVTQLSELADEQVQTNPIKDWYLLKLRAALADFVAEAVN